MAAAGQNFHQKFRLAAKKFRHQPGVLARLVNRGKIDMGGEVLSAGIRQKVVGGVVAEIGAERSTGARGRKHFVGGEAVVNGQQFAARQNAGGLAPPIFRGGRGFDGVAVGQDSQKRRWKIEDGGWQFGILQFHPHKFIAVNCHAPLEPFFVFRVPAEAVDGKGVEEFVAENDAA